MLSEILNYQFPTLVLQTTPKNSPLWPQLVTSPPTHRQVFLPVPISSFPVPTHTPRSSPSPLIFDFFRRAICTAPHYMRFATQQNFPFEHNRMPSAPKASRSLSLLLPTDLSVTRNHSLQIHLPHLHLSDRPVSRLHQPLHHPLRVFAPTLHTAATPLVGPPPVS